MTSAKVLAKMLDELVGMWLNRVEFIHEKGLNEEYFKWKTKKKEES